MIGTPSNSYKFSEPLQKKKELQKCTTSCSYNTNEQMSPLCVIFTGLLWVGVQVKEISVDNFQYEF